MSALQENHPYNELPKDDTFRYLVLQPGVGYEPIECNLHTAQIADTEYHAISYVWGTDIRDHKISCDGHDMMVTENLIKALQCVRLSDRPIALWADSICINQEDMDEKGHQVSLMGKVYRSAKCVLICIGTDDGGHGPHACSILDEVDEMIQSTCKRIDMTWNSFPYPSDDDALLDDIRWNSLYALLNQDWFRRGWVVQEAALAARAEVLWGKSRFDWQKLMRTNLWLVVRGTKTYYAREFGNVAINAHFTLYRQGHQDTARAFQREAITIPPSSLEALDDAKSLSLKDPRDRIYAFMELSQNDAHRMTIDPNYLSPYLEVYHEFATMYIKSSRNIGLLDYVCHDENSLSDVPSWVPRWDIPDFSLAQRISSSSTMQPRTANVFEPLVTKDGSLHVRGVVIDTVHYVSELLEQGTTTPETLRRVWKCMNTEMIKSPYTETSESHMLDAFLDAVSTGGYNGDWAQWLQARESFAATVKNFDSYGA